MCIYCSFPSHSLITNSICTAVHNCCLLNLMLNYTIILLYITLQVLLEIAFSKSQQRQLNWQTLIHSMFKKVTIHKYNDHTQQVYAINAGNISGRRNFFADFFFLVLQEIYIRPSLQTAT